QDQRRFGGGGGLGGDECGGGGVATVAVAVTAVGGAVDRAPGAGQVERLLPPVADRAQDEEPGDERDRGENHRERAADGRAAIADTGRSAGNLAGTVGYVAHACAPPCASVPVSNRSR